MSEVARIESEELHQYIDSIANSIANSIADKHRDHKELVIVGIANGGIPFSINLARALEKNLGHPVPCGSVDISFHRDDIGHKPITSIDNPTVLPVNIEDATVILADDVLFSGRTARAALNEIFDQGRRDGRDLSSWQYFVIGVTGVCLFSPITSVSQKKRPSIRK